MVVEHPLDARLGAAVQLHRPGRDRDRVLVLGVAEALKEVRTALLGADVHFITRLGKDPFTGEERMFAAKPASTKIKTRALKKLKDAAL